MSISNNIPSLLKFVDQSAQKISTTKPKILPPSMSPKQILVLSGDTAQNFGTKNLPVQKSSEIFEQNSSHVKFERGFYFCELCNVRCQKKPNLEQHLRGTRHRNSLAVCQMDEKAAKITKNIEEKMEEKIAPELPKIENVAKTPSSKQISAKPKDSPTKQTKNKDQKYFGCEICCVHGMPYSLDAVQLHLNSKAHKYMTIFWDNGMWPGPVEKCNKSKQKEPQIYKFLDRKGTALCELCNEATPDGNSLFLHQQSAEHYRKLTQNVLADKTPVIYVCENTERLATEDCAAFYNNPNGCLRGKPSCPYRHCYAALNSIETCKIWESGKVCVDPKCRARHSKIQGIEVVPHRKKPLLRSGPSPLGDPEKIWGANVDESTGPVTPTFPPIEQTMTASTSAKVYDKSKETPSSKSLENAPRMEVSYSKKPVAAATTAVGTAENSKQKPLEPVCETSVVNNLEIKQMPTSSDSNKTTTATIVEFIKNLKAENAAKSSFTSDSNLQPKTVQAQNTGLNATPANLAEFLQNYRKSADAAVAQTSAPNPGRVDDSLETLTKLLTASQTDENVDVILIVALQNELSRPDCDQMRVLLIQKLVQMRLERKEQQKRLAQFARLIPALTQPAYSPSAAATGTTSLLQPDFMSLLMPLLLAANQNSVTSAVPPNIPAIPPIQPSTSEMGYFSRNEVSVSQAPLKMATRFAAICGMKKEELEKKLNKFQADDPSISNFVYSGKDSLEKKAAEYSKLEILNITSGDDLSDICSSDDNSNLSNISSGEYSNLLDANSDRKHRMTGGKSGKPVVQMEAISDDELEIIEEHRTMNNLRKKRHSSPNMAANNSAIKKMKINVAFASDDAHAGQTTGLNQPGVWNSDPAVSLYYEDDDEDAGRADDEEEKVDMNDQMNLVVEVGVNQQQQENKQKVSAFERLGYFTQRGRRSLSEKKKQYKSSNTLIRTVQNDLYRFY